jgi:hypothetical protein
MLCYTRKKRLGLLWLYTDVQRPRPAPNEKWYGDDDTIIEKCQRNVGDPLAEAIYIKLNRDANQASRKEPALARLGLA